MGNITATEKVDTRENGKVEGDIGSPTVAIADSAHFRGSIDMQRGAAETGTATSKETAAPATPLTSKSSEAKRSLQPAARSTKIPTRQGDPRVGATEPLVFGLPNVEQEGATR